MNLIFENGTLKKHDEVPPSSIVYVVETTEGINDLAALYCCSRCSLLEPSITSNQGKIDSIRWRGCIKGRNGGFFNPQTVMFDIWDSGRPRHTKISKKNKIQLCGMKSEAAAQRILDAIVTNIKAAQKYLQYTRTKAFRLATKWLLDNARGDPIEFTKYSTIKKKELGTIEICEEFSDYKIVWPKESSYPEAYKEDIEEFLARSDDLILLGEDVIYSDLVERVESFSTFEDIVTPGYAIKNIKISDYIYFYSMGFLPDRNALENVLARKGYDPSYNKKWSHCVLVETKSKIKVNSDTIHRRDKDSDVDLQQFTFYPKGKIRHNGPSREAMADCYTKLMTNLLKSKKEIMIENLPD